MFLQLEWEWIIWSHQPAILGIWSLGSLWSRHQNGIVSAVELFWPGATACEGRREEEAGVCVWRGAGQVLGPRHRSDTAEGTQGNQEDWLKAALRTSWPGRRRTAEPRLPVRGLAQPWIPHHVCSLAGAPHWEWRPCEHRVGPKGAAAPSCQLRGLPAALCLCKEGLRGALPWLVQSFTFFQWHFPNHILVLSSLKCSEVLTAVLVAFVHSH